MGRAYDCKLCGTDRHLQWKTWDEDLWWIHCDQCGAIGPSKPTMREAGMAWNEQNKVEEPTRKLDDL